MKLSALSSAALVASSAVRSAEGFSPGTGTGRPPVYPALKSLQGVTSPVTVSAQTRAPSSLTSMRSSPLDRGTESLDTIDDEQSGSDLDEETSKGQLPGDRPESCLVKGLVRPTQVKLEQVLTDSTLGLIRGGQTGDTTGFVLHALNLLAVGGTLEQLNSCFGALPEGATDKTA